MPHNSLHLPTYFTDLTQILPREIELEELLNAVIVESDADHFVLSNFSVNWLTGGFVMEFIKPPSLALGNFLDSKLPKTPSSSEGKFIKHKKGEQSEQFKVRRMWKFSFH